MTNSSTDSSVAVAPSLLKSFAECFGDTRLSGTAWLARFSVFFYAFVLPFTHNAALKNLGLAAMLVALALTVFRRGLHVDFRSPILAPILVVFGLALVSSMAGGAAMESLDACRKQFLPMLVLIPLVLAYFRQRRALLILLGTIALAFSIRSILALYEMALYETASVSRQEGLFFKGYGMEAVLHMAVVAGLLISLAGRWRLFAGIILLITAAAVVVNGSRTGVAAITLGCLVIPLLLGRKRAFVVLVLAGAAIAASVVVVKPELASYYKRAFQTSSYVGPTGMSTRYPIWMGVWQVAQEKPVFGHGVGWKKLGDTAMRGGFVDRWQSSGDPYDKVAAWYFSLPTDKVNPHNLALQLLFEVGFAGLVAYAAMLALLFWQAIVLALRGPPEWRPLAATVTGFLVSYAIMNISNGLWIGAGPSAVLLAILELCRQVRLGKL